MTAHTGEDAPRVGYDKRGPVAHVTIDRPAVLNALDTRTHEELRHVWTDFEADDELRVAVLTGAGDRAFSVGQDLKEYARRLEAGAEPNTFGSRGQPGHPRLTDRFDLTKPVIARVRGYALGGGFELALACDVIVAAEGSTFGLPEARLGLVAGAGGVFRLTRQLPYRLAMGHLLTGRHISAETALRHGLVNEVVPGPALDDAVTSWTDDIVRCAPLSVRAIKEAALRSAGGTVEQAFGLRYPWEERRVRSQDAREGPQAFLEGRPPRWQGR